MRRMSFFFLGIVRRTHSHCILFVRSFVRLLFSFPPSKYYHDIAKISLKCDDNLSNRFSIIIIYNMHAKMDISCMCVYVYFFFFSFFFVLFLFLYIVCCASRARKYKSKDTTLKLRAIKILISGLYVFTWSR